MTEFIIDLSEVEKSSDRFKFLFNESIPLGKRIVRCRDCKGYRDSDSTCHSWQWNNWDEPIEVEPDGFCAWGERR